MSINSGDPFYGKTEDGFEYKTWGEYMDLSGIPSGTDEYGQPIKNKAARDVAEGSKGLTQANKARLKGMQGKKTPLLSTGDQSKVRNVLSTGPVGDAVSTGLGTGQTAAKTLLGL